MILAEASARVWGFDFLSARHRLYFARSLKCILVPSAAAALGVIDRPFFAVTGENGTYEIEVWQEFWTEKLRAMKFTVTLEDGDPKICDIVYAGGKQAQAHLR